MSRLKRGCEEKSVNVRMKRYTMELFKEELKRRGMKIELSAPGNEMLKKGVAAVLNGITDFK